MSEATVKPKLTLEQARKECRCRICGDEISTQDLPAAWTDRFDGIVVEGRHVSIKMGSELAHSVCLSGENPTFNPMGQPAEQTV